MNLNKEQMVALYRNLVRADHFDKMMSRRIMTGKLIGFYHRAEGAIAPGVGAATFLRKDDFLSPHHRGHGMPHILSKGADLKYYLAEHTGKEDGCCRGRSSWHWSYPEYNIHMASGFIGYNFSPAVGWAWSSKRRGNGQVVMNCSGDGSYGQGRSHEAMLMAMNWKLPLIFFCENNGMAIYANIQEMHPTEDVSSLAQGYGMPAVVVDGQDVFAVAEVVNAAIKRAREGKGPTFIEAKCLRFHEHDVGTPDLDGYNLRTDELHEEMRQREPLTLATARVLGDEILTQNEIDEFHEEAAREVAEAERFADESPISEPSEEELLNAVYA